VGVIDNRSEEELETRLNATVSSKTTFITSSKEEFLFFDYGLPDRGYSLGSKVNCEEKREEEWFERERGFEADNETYEIHDMWYEDNLFRGCDSKIFDVERKTVRHVVWGSFIGNELGFLAVYQSPAGQDEDLYPIIENMQCYQ